MAMRIKRLRQEAGLSQNDLAGYLGISRIAVVKYENGTSRPVRRLDKLAAVLGASADYLLTGKTEKPDSFSDMLEKILLPAEIKLLKTYRRLDANGKAVINATMDALALQVKN